MMIIIIITITTTDSISMGTWLLSLGPARQTRCCLVTSRQRFRLIIIGIIIFIAFVHNIAIIGIIENIDRLFHIWCALKYKVQLATGHGQQRLHVDLHHREHEQRGGGEQVERATLIKRSLAKKARCHCLNPMGEAISFSHPPPTLEKGLLLAAL